MCGHNNKMKKHIKSIALMLATASATFIISLLAFRAYYGMNSDLFDEIRAYAEAREYISELFVGEVDESELTDTAISAVIEALDDRWSYYLTADEYEAYVQKTNNLYQGIGIGFSRLEDTNEIEISSVTAGSPAEAAGLLAGEIITGLNGESVTEITDETVREIVMENLGGTVTLTVSDSRGKSRTVEVACQEYSVDPVSYELIEGDIGYIEILNFENNSGADGIAAIEELVSKGALSLIFDVRNNPGGKVSELLELLDYILPEGEMFITADKNGDETIKTSDAASIELPIVILVNKNSYSAAEYFAAILQEYGRAETVGEATTGKGRSQITLSLSDGSAIHISTKRYFTPNRVDLSETGGIQPDHEIQLESELDEQLQKAIEILNF